MTDSHFLLIKDEAEVAVDDDGTCHPSFRFVDELTVRAHPRLVRALVHVCGEEVEPVWSLEDLLEGSHVR